MNGQSEFRLFCVAYFVGEPWKSASLKNYNFSNFRNHFHGDNYCAYRSSIKIPLANRFLSFHTVRKGRGQILNLICAKL